MFLLRFFFFFMIRRSLFTRFAAYECNLTLERLRQEDPLEFEASLGYNPIF